MSRLLVFIFCAFAALPLPAAEQIADILHRAPVLNPNFSTFPESSLMSHASRLEAPAGKYGFIVSQDGHFFYGNGQRARFFGVNLAKDTVFIEKKQIDRLVDLFARAGINLVRLHHIDDTQGILDPDPHRFFRNDRLDLVDYWIAKLKANGIYVALDLNDYRTFRESEGVVNGEKLGRGAKPYAVFNPRLIELQKEYARRFLVDHVNPYTGLSYAKEPAIAMLELYDENGLFIRRGDWGNLHDPYFRELLQAWNKWLQKRYKTHQGLVAAWTDNNGQSAIVSTENLDQNTVLLPRMELDVDLRPVPANRLMAPARVSDGAQFAYEVQINYLTTMTRYLRSLGVRIPVTAVGAQDIIPDLMATAAVTDYIGVNYYWDHPIWLDGKEWTTPFFFALNNPVADNPNYAFPVTVSVARMHGKPLVVRELGYCYPNPYRGTGMIEAAAYGAFLDLDALILFTYDAHLSSRTIGYFDIHLDPLRWGLVTDAARIFLSGEVKPAKYTTGIGYSQTDAFTWYYYLSPLYRLAFSTQVVNYTATKTPHPFNLLVASGRSAGERWRGPNLLVFANHNHADLQFHNRSQGLDTLQGYDLNTGRSGAFNMTFQGIGYDAGSVQSIQAWPAYSTGDVLANGLLPIATNNSATYGFLDSKRKVIGFRNLRPELAVRVALDALHNWSGAPVSHNDADRNRFTTDTSQLTRDMSDRLLLVDTPTLQAIAGRLDSRKVIQTSAMKLTTTTPIGTLIAESLDEQALSQSTNFVVKMTSRAVNDMVKLEQAPHGPKPFKLTSAGVPPIRTGGKPDSTPTHVVIGGKLLIDLYLQNGTWEYLVEPNRALLYLDTGDVDIVLPAQPKLVRIHTYKDVIEFTPNSRRLNIPSGVRYTEIVY